MRSGGYSDLVKEELWKLAGGTAQELEISRPRVRVLGRGFRITKVPGELEWSGWSMLQKG